MDLRGEDVLQTQYYDFKRLLRTGGTPRGVPLSRRISQLWANALDVLNGDNQELHHRLVRDLVSDELRGYDFISFTMKMEDADNAVTFPSVNDFLKVITHPSLLDPMSIDSFVSTVYSFFGGSNGDRAIDFFSRLCKRLRDSPPNPDPSTEEMILQMVRAISTLQARQPKSGFNDGFPQLLDILQALIPPSEPAANKTSEASVRINFLKRSITRGRSRLVTADPQPPGPSNTQPPGRSVYPMDVVVPGGRHDNDFADISQIQILPTYGEITSTAAECLPSTNLLQPHYLGDMVPRHIDSAFRLLRHDIFGPVKDVLRDLLGQDISNTSQKPHIRADAGARLYRKAGIAQVFVERNGLEVAVSFETPPQLGGKSVAEQRRWWQDSSRLEEQALVAFVYSHGEDKKLLFLEVTAKKTENTKGGRDNISLVSKDHPPKIQAKLASFTQDNVSVLLKIHTEHLKGVLVEFNGLIPATFAPILANLKQMMRDGEMPFQQWILPTTGPDGSNTTNIIPPPAYARKRQLVLNLDPISKVPGLTITPSTASIPGEVDFPKLEEATGLDHGQCRGLVAALCREYALIQGPPGTGKSYLGVKLVRLLLHNKLAAGLGPILVM